MSRMRSPLDGYGQYPGQTFKILTAILVANAIILYEEKPSLIVIFSNRGFYIASLFSSILAYLAVLYVFSITKLLDQQYPWGKNHSRLVLQLTLGVLLPILPLFLAAAFYFNLHHVNIFNTVYLRRYMLLICLFLIVLSSYLHYLWEMKNKSKKTPKSLLVGEAVKTNLQLPATEIAYLFAEDKNCYAVNFYGEKISWNLTLEKSLIHLPEELFCRIHRGIIVNFTAIEEVKILDAKKTLIILVSPITRVGFSAEFSLPIKKEFSASTRENANFKRCYVAFRQQKIKLEGNTNL